MFVIFFSICSILSKVEDLASGLSQFSLKVNTSSPIEEVIICKFHLEFESFFVVFISTYYSYISITQLVD